MKINPFNKSKKVSDKVEDKIVVNAENAEVSSDADVFVGVGGAGAYRVLKNFYVSEKASLGSAYGQYTFKVASDANKSEVKKEVSKLFNVKVKDVKIINLPEKRRDFGRRPGVKPGFKKAIVILKEGQTIGQARP